MTSIDRDRQRNNDRRPASLTTSQGEAARAADQILLAALQQAGSQVIASAATPAGEPQPEDRRPPARRPLDHFVRLSDVAPEDVHWLSPGRIAAGKITLLDGDPGLGKSTLLCEFAARVTRGEPLPGGHTADPRGVILLSAEDDLHDTIRPRIDAAGGDPHRVVTVVTMPDRTPAGRPFVIVRDAPLLEAIASRIDAALVIIDPLGGFLGPGHNANNASHVRRAFTALQSVATNTGVAIVVVRHLNKTSDPNPLYRGGGSIGIIAAARCGLVLACDPENPERRILAVSKGNLTRPPASLAFRLASAAGSGVARVVWEGESRWTAAQLLRAAAEGDEHRSLVHEARSWLRAALAGGPRPAKDMLGEAAERGVARSTLLTARKAEGVAVHKERVANGRWLWSLHDASGEESGSAADHMHSDSSNSSSSSNSSPHP